MPFTGTKKEKEYRKKKAEYMKNKRQRQKNEQDAIVEKEDSVFDKANSEEVLSEKWQIENDHQVMQDVDFDNNINLPNQQHILDIENLGKELDNDNDLHKIIIASKVDIKKYIGRKTEKLSSQIAELTNEVIQMKTQILQSLKLLNDQTFKIADSGAHGLLQNILQDAQQNDIKKIGELNLITNQVQSMKKHELEILERHYDGEGFWNYFKQFGYLQFAVFMMVLQSKSSKPKTIKNNVNTLQKISDLYQQRKITNIRHKDLVKCSEFLSSEFKDLRKLSTIQGYLSHFNNMVHLIYGFDEFTAKIQYKSFAKRRGIIEMEDLKRIIHEYSKSTNEICQQVGFYLYLLLETGARNESIRTIEFSQFEEVKDKQETRYIVNVYQKKNNKVSCFGIPKATFDFVKSLQQLRKTKTEQMKQQNVNPDMIKRRQNSVFTFYTQSAVHHHIKKMKEQYKEKVNELDNFIIHNIRAMRIRYEFQRKGIKAAQEMAQHANPRTTFQHYLAQPDFAGIIEWETKPVVDDNFLLHEEDKPINEESDSDDDDDDDDDSEDNANDFMVYVNDENNPNQKPIKELMQEDEMQQVGETVQSVNQVEESKHVDDIIQQQSVQINTSLKAQQTSNLTSISLKSKSISKKQPPPSPHPRALRQFEQIDERAKQKLRHFKKD